MFNYEWKNRIKALENKIAAMEQKTACAKGEHKWELKNAGDKDPYIRCTECWKQPEKKAAP